MVFSFVELRRFIASLIVGRHTKDNEVWGVAPNVTIVPLKVMKGTVGSIGHIINAIDYGYDLGVRIFNISLDTYNYNEELFHTIKMYEDAIFITSAGKAKSNVEQIPVYPCNFDLDNVICVSAVDNKGELETYTGYGTNPVLAPGVNIYGVLPEGDYIYSVGTSLSTAYVTGIVALARSVDPNILVDSLVNFIRKGNKKIELDDRTIEIIDAKKVLDKVKNNK